MIRGFHGCFRVLPLLCYTLSPVSALRCCPLHRLSLYFALLRRAPLRVHLALPLLPRSPLWPWWLRSSAWSFFCLSSAVWGFCDSFRPPLSVSGSGPAVPLLLVVGPVTTGAAAPVPEALVPHLDCLRSRWCLAYIDRYLVTLLPLAVGFSQAPLPPCSLFVEFLLLLLLLVVMSFCLGLSVYAPHLVAPARSVSLLASGLPGSSLLPPCSVGAVLLGFYGSGCYFMAG